mmetsp:Transcript_22117/g.58578  ORF Transcript_22117/g.58578 Transcript_22117/m.58578 type:complete len:1080 (-) Transcript_22117:186-3425(-)
MFPVSPRLQGNVLDAQRPPLSELTAALGRCTETRVYGRDVLLAVGGLLDVREETPAQTASPAEREAADPGAVIDVRAAQSLAHVSSIQLADRENLGIRRFRRVPDPEKDRAFRDYYFLKHIRLHQLPPADFREVSQETKLRALVVALQNGDMHLVDAMQPESSVFREQLGALEVDAQVATILLEETVEGHVAQRRRDARMRAEAKEGRLVSGREQFDEFEWSDASTFATMRNFHQPLIDSVRWCLARGASLQKLLSRDMLLSCPEPSQSSVPCCSKSVLSGDCAILASTSEGKPKARSSCSSSLQESQRGYGKTGGAAGLLTPCVFSWSGYQQLLLVVRLLGALERYDERLLQLVLEWPEENKVSREYMQVCAEREMLETEERAATHLPRRSRNISKDGQENFQAPSSRGRNLDANGAGASVMKIVDWVRDLDGRLLKVHRDQEFCRVVGRRCRANLELAVMQSLQRIQSVDIVDTWLGQLVKRYFSHEFIEDYDQLKGELSGFNIQRQAAVAIGLSLDLRNERHRVPTPMLGHLVTGFKAVVTPLIAELRDPRLHQVDFLRSGAQDPATCFLVPFERWADCSVHTNRRDGTDAWSEEIEALRVVMRDGESLRDPTSGGNAGDETLNGRRVSRGSESGSGEGDSDSSDDEDPVIAMALRMRARHTGRRNAACSPSTKPGEFPGSLLHEVGLRRRLRLRWALAAEPRRGQPAATDPFVFAVPREQGDRVANTGVGALELPLGEDGVPDLYAIASEPRASASDVVSLPADCEGLLEDAKRRANAHHHCISPDHVFRHDTKKLSKRKILNHLTCWEQHDTLVEQREKLNAHARWRLRQSLFNRYLFGACIRKWSLVLRHSEAKAKESVAGDTLDAGTEHSSWWDYLVDNENSRADSRQALLDLFSLLAKDVKERGAWHGGARKDAVDGGSRNRNDARGADDTGSSTARTPVADQTAVSRGGGSGAQADLDASLFQEHILQGCSPASCSQSAAVAQQLDELVLLLCSDFARFWSIETGVPEALEGYERTLPGAAVGRLAEALACMTGQGDHAALRVSLKNLLRKQLEIDPRTMLMFATCFDVA